MPEPNEHANVQDGDEGERDDVGGEEERDLKRNATRPKDDQISSMSQIISFAVRVLGGAELKLT